MEPVTIHHRGDVRASGNWPVFGELEAQTLEARPHDVPAGKRTGPTIITYCCHLSRRSAAGATPVIFSTSSRPFVSDQRLVNTLRRRRSDVSRWATSMLCFCWTRSDTENR